MEASDIHLKGWVWGQKRVVRIIFGASISCSELGVVRNVLECKVPFFHFYARVELIRC
jgi:hypothetical protein